MNTILDNYIENQTKCYKNYMKLKGFIGIARAFKSGKNIEFDNNDINLSCGISKQEEIKNLLIQLGEFRKFTVKELFNLALNKVSTDYSKDIKDIKAAHFFIDTGSTNITSDYDVTVSGPYCSQVIKYMFEIYNEQFQTVLPVGFDSNLYPGTATFPTIDGLHESFSGETPPKGFLHVKITIGDYGPKKILLPMITKRLTKTNEDRQSLQLPEPSTVQNYQWACSKLHDGLSQLYKADYTRVVKTFPSNFQSFLTHGEKISQICKKKFCDVHTVEAVDNRKQTEANTDYELNSEANSLNKSYIQMWTHCEALDKYYREGFNSPLPHLTMKVPKELTQYVNTSLGYSNLVAWLCSEAYYSSFTVYAIVVCLQLGYNGDGFIKHVWLVAIIENLADLIKHMLHAISHSEYEHNNDASKILDDEYKKMYITYSKYYYRIYYCLTKYYSMASTDKTEEYNKAKARLGKLEHALLRRKDFDITKADDDNIFLDGDCLNIKNINNPREWLKTTAEDLMTKLNSVLPTQSGGKRKKKTRKRSKKRKRKNRSKKRKPKKI